MIGQKYVTLSTTHGITILQQTGETNPEIPLIVILFNGEPLETTVGEGLMDVAEPQAALERTYREAYYDYRLTKTEWRGCDLEQALAATAKELFDRDLYQEAVETNWEIHYPKVTVGWLDTKIKSIQTEYEIQVSGRLMHMPTVYGPVISRELCIAAKFGDLSLTQPWRELKVNELECDWVDYVEVCTWDEVADISRNYINGFLKAVRAIGL